MSANNQLLIVELSNGWEVRNVDVDSGEHYVVEKTNTLKGAIERAHRFIEENSVEYGMDFIFLKH